MSPRRVWSSQSDTVRRKLSIMIPIPTVVDTATTRAAVATPVRLIDAGMLRATILPGVPKTRERTGWIPRTRRVTAPGVKSAYPATRQNRPKNDGRMLREGYSLHAGAQQEQAGARRRDHRQDGADAVSIAERRMTSRGGVVVASWAGHSDAAADPRVPRRRRLEKRRRGGRDVPDGHDEVQVPDGARHHPQQELPEEVPEGEAQDRPRDPEDRPPRRGPARTPPSA